MLKTAKKCDTQFNDTIGNNSPCNMLTVVGISKLPFTYRHLVVKILFCIKMLFIFSTPVIFRHLWQLKTVVLLHRCLIQASLLPIIVYAECRYGKCHHTECVANQVLI